jgi:hypothetical protein
MKRDYETGVKEDVRFFIGTEVEHTKFHGLKTLFVVGYKSVDDITNLAAQNQIEHIFLGANHSWPSLGTVDGPKLIKKLLAAGYKVTVDCTFFEALGLSWHLEPHDNFCLIAQMRSPNIERLTKFDSYIKIDDNDFKATNSGVWVHNLKDILSDEHKTEWSKYTNDSIIS